MVVIWVRERKWIGEMWIGDNTGLTTNTTPHPTPQHNGVCDGADTSAANTRGKSVGQCVGASEGDDKTLGTHLVSSA